MSLHATASKKPEDPLIGPIRVLVHLLVSVVVPSPSLQFAEEGEIGVKRLCDLAFASSEAELRQVAGIEPNEIVDLHSPEGLSSAAAVFVVSWCMD